MLKVELDAAAPRGIVVPFPLHAWKQCADFAVVFAATNPEQGRWGILAFIVIERGTTGFEQSEALPIGQVWDETKGLVFDEHDQPVESGEEGELLICSPARMLGYWNKPELNGNVFFTSSGRSGGKEVYFRTGDIVTTNVDGALVFVRRKDQQVKVRGYRVELGDIESALVSHQNVEEAVAFATTGHDDNARIAAVVTLRDQNSRALKELSRHAASLLPRYAVPSTIKPMAELPHTSSGKINRLAVRELFSDTS